MANYVDALESAFAKAAQRVGEVTAAMVLAGKCIRMRLAGDTLSPALMGALAHLSRADAGQIADLEIRCWDSAATAESFPEPPWQWPQNAAATVALPRSPFRLWTTPARDALILFDVRRRRAVFWARSAESLPTHWYASPLLMLFHWWANSEDLHLLHAGCVGLVGDGILLGGRGGSGKSTIALLALLDGFKYVSDDYCVLESGSPPRAHCLYSTAKLERQHLMRFSEFGHLATDPLPDEYGKPVLYLAPHYPGQISGALALRCVVLPRLTVGGDTRWEPVSAPEALRALAPTTLLQLPDAHGSSFSALAMLVRQLPCFRLEFGARRESVGPALREMLAAVR